MTALTKAQADRLAELHGEVVDWRGSLSRDAHVIPFRLEDWRKSMTGLEAAQSAFAAYLASLTVQP